MELVRQVLKKKAKVLKTMKITLESHLDPKMKLQRRSCTCQIEFDKGHFD